MYLSKNEIALYKSWERSLRVCVDLDNVVCPPPKEDETYQDVIPYPEAVSALRLLKSMGCIVILHTARHQISLHGDRDAILDKLDDYLYQWLELHKVPYDSVEVKPYANLYIDDRAIRHVDWRETVEGIKEMKKALDKACDD